MRRLRRLLIVVVVAVLVFAGAGYFLFTRPHVDPLTKADAIVVLGGDWDGRIEYGLDLARRGYVDTVLLSTGYVDHHADVHRFCSEPVIGVKIICFTPDPYSTLGEAEFASEQARKRGWTHLIVVSWNFHMVRARYIFRQCFDGRLTMRPVRLSYDELDWENWAWIYTYQYAAIAKAAILGCH